MSGSVSQAELLLSKATTAEHRQDWDQAFRLYLEAAQTFLSLYRATSDEKLRERCKVSAGKALQRAEKIKAVKPDLTPVAVNPFSKDEQTNVLRTSSQINGRRYPLWSESLTLAPASDDLHAQPELSPEQIKLSVVWRRAIEALPEPSIITSLLYPDSIIQHVVTDCSLCASLSVCLEHHRRFGSKLGLLTLYPQDADNVPCLSETGRYDLRLFLNGGYRRVVIDDQLPIHPNGTLLCMSTRAKTHMWPSLIEKAFMKVQGGYDFPGSNSSIDVHTLTGWIPEHIDIKSSTFQREKTWSRVFMGFHAGQCVCTVGTGQGVVPSRISVKLQASHCYAIIDIGEIDAERKLSIISTWDSSLDDDCVDTAPSAQPKILDILWDDVCNVFDGLYLNWDPQLFAHILDFHGVWLPDRFRADDLHSSTRHLQLQVKHSAVDDTLQEVWVLLSRHTRDTCKKKDFMALQVKIDDGPASPEIDKIAHKGHYTNSPHILVKTQIPLSFSSRSTLSIFASYDGPSQDIGFTITAYSSSTLSWNESMSKASFTSKLEGSLTIKSSGGSYNYPTFMTNPQYHLCVRPEQQQQQSSSGMRAISKAQISLALHGPREIPLNIMIVWSKGQRIVELVKTDIVVNSGAYSYGFARVSAELLVGNYTVIISAFEPHYTGAFSLRTESSHPFELKAISQEGAGMYSKTIRGAWNECTAMGSPSFNRYQSNPIFALILPAPAELIIRLQLAQPPALSPLNITLFRPSNDGSLGGQVVTSGPYSDAISGVAIPRVALKAGTYWLVPSTYDPGVQAHFQVVVYSTVAGVDISAKEII